MNEGGRGVRWDWVRQSNAEGVNETGSEGVNEAE